MVKNAKSLGDIHGIRQSTNHPSAVTAAPVASAGPKMSTNSMRFGLKTRTHTDSPILHCQMIAIAINNELPTEAFSGRPISANAAAINRNAANSHEVINRRIEAKSKITI